VDRILLLTDELQFIPPLIVPALVEAVAGRDDVVVAGICVPRRLSGLELEWTWGRRRLERTLQGIFSRPTRTWPWPDPRWLRRLAKKHSLPVVAPPGGGFADSGFVRDIRERFAPTLIFNCYCLAKLSPELLETSDMAVNYHNGKLPEFRGLRATHFSVYHGEPTSGFTFHRMTEGLDEGPILLEGAVPVRPENTVFDLEHLKGRAASDRVPDLLEAMLRRDPGRPQKGRARRFLRRDWQEMRTLERPEELSSGEIFRRLRSFSILKIRIGASLFDVTALAESRQKQGPRSFRTEDDVWLRPTRYGFLPYLLYLPMRRVWARR